MHADRFANGGDFQLINYPSLLKDQLEQDCNAAEVDKLSTSGPQLINQDEETLPVERKQSEDESVNDNSRVLHDLLHPPNLSTMSVFEDVAY